MKSRIHQEKAYQTVDFSAYQRAFHPDESLIQNEVQRLQNRGLCWEDGTVAGNGDAAMCSLESENPRFHKPAVYIAIGSGMLPTAIEQALSGMVVDTEKTVEVDGQAVRIRLLSVKNKRLPELTDTWIAGMGMAGITTLDQFRTQLIRQQREEQSKLDAYEAAQFVVAQVLQETEFILFKEDWETVVNLELERHSELCRQEGLDIKTMTAQEFRGRIPASSYDGVVSLVKSNAWRTLRNFLLGYHYAELDGYKVDQNTYEEYIQNYQATWRVSEENARASNTYEFYRVNTYAAYFVEKVTQFVREHIYLEE